MPLLVALSKDRPTRRCSRGQSPQARPQGSGGSSPASSQHPEPMASPTAPRKGPLNLNTQRGNPGPHGAACLGVFGKPQVT